MNAGHQSWHGIPNCTEGIRNKKNGAAPKTKWTTPIPLKSIFYSVGLFLKDLLSRIACPSPTLPIVTITLIVLTVYYIVMRPPARGQEACKLSETAPLVAASFNSTLLFRRSLFEGLALQYGLTLANLLLHHSANFKRKSEQCDEALGVFVVVEVAGLEAGYAFVVEAVF